MPCGRNCGNYKLIISWIRVQHSTITSHFFWWNHHFCWWNQQNLNGKSCEITSFSGEITIFFNAKECVSTIPRRRSWPRAYLRRRPTALDSCCRWTTLLPRPRPFFVEGLGSGKVGSSDWWNRENMEYISIYTYIYILYLIIFIYIYLFN